MSDRPVPLPVVALPGGSGCRLYRAGHHIHAIQARFALEEPGPAGWVFVEDGRVVWHPAEGRSFAVNNHQPEELLALVERNGPDGWHLSNSVLFNARTREGLSVSIGARPWTECKE